MIKAASVAWRCPLGLWTVEGFWRPNTFLKMSADEQLKINEANGFVCKLQVPLDASS